MPATTAPIAAAVDPPRAPSPEIEVDGEVNFGDSNAGNGEVGDGNEALRQKMVKEQKPLHDGVGSVLAPSVIEGANFLSVLTFRFLSPLVALGYKRPLQTSDVPRLGAKDEGSSLRPSSMLS